MTELTIERLTASVASDDGALHARARRLLGHIAEHRLDDAVRAWDPPPGEWCIRRVDVELAIDDADDDAAIERAWATSIREALRASLAGRRDDTVVYYPRRSDAVADAVTSICAGRLGRLWAWRRLDVVHVDDPDPSVHPMRAVVAILARHHGDALVPLLRAMHALGAAAVHRVLGATGWQEVATSVRSLPSTTRATATAGGGISPGAMRGLVDELVARSSLAAAVRAS